MAINGENITACVEGAQQHRQLAAGYESVGADAQEIREYIRGIYLQNEAIMLMLQAIGATMSAFLEWELPSQRQGKPHE